MENIATTHQGDKVSSSIVLSHIKRIEIEKADKFSMVTYQDFDMIPYDNQSPEATAYRIELLISLFTLTRIHSTSYIQLSKMKKLNFSNLSDISDIVALSTEKVQLNEILKENNIIERAKRSYSLIQKSISEHLKSKGQSVAQLAQLYPDLFAHLKGFEQLQNKQQQTSQQQQQTKANSQHAPLLANWKKKIEEINKDKENLTPEILKIVKEEMNKFETLRPEISEFSITKNYLDWILYKIPWNTYTEDHFDIIEAEKILNENHFGLKSVKERIIEFIAVGSVKKNIQLQKGKILCFVGPPGVGKTSIGKSIADALGRKFYRFSVGGLRDISEIKGHRRVYLGAYPGKIIQALKSVGSFNPVILIDEIEKLSSPTHNGDPSAGFLEILDPQQNTNFTDYFLDIPIDLSKVLFICTANSTDSIPNTLLDRMEIIEVEGYSPFEKKEILQNHIIPNVALNHSLSSDLIQFHDDSLQKFIEYYSLEPGLRTLMQHIESLFRKISVDTIKNNYLSNSIHIYPDNLQEYFGFNYYSHFIPQSWLNDRFLPPGIVTGLGYNALKGGSVIMLETVTFPSSSSSDSSSGIFTVSGHFGETISESIIIARKVAASIVARIDPSNQFFKNVFFFSLFLLF